MKLNFKYPGLEVRKMPIKRQYAQVKDVIKFSRFQFTADVTPFHKDFVRNSESNS